MMDRLRSRVIEYVILANAFMFIVRLAAPELTARYLAVTPATVHMMPWTIITNMFVHVDFIHIFFNMFFGVLMFGTYFENIVGEREFAKVYFTGGIAAALFYVFVSLTLGLPDPRTPALGASGAVFAIMGALVVLRPDMIIYVYFFPMRLKWFALLYLIYGLIAVPTNLGGTVAVTAHIGGLITGLIMGRRYLESYRPPQYTYVRYY